jgi:soluble cytochrome b562
MSRNKPVRLMLAAMVVFPSALLISIARSAAAETKKTELHDKMEQIDESMKKLRRTLRSADSNAESLELISKAQQAAIACKAMTPSRAATVPEPERKKFVAEYRKQMAGVIGQMLQMEIAVLDGNNEKAQQIHKELKTLEEKGHDKFMQEEDKK